MDKIKIEGQELEMPENIARDDAALKDALAPYFPGAANAKFMRSEEKDGVITVTVVKQAGTKGAKVLRSEDKDGVTMEKLVELASTKGGGDESQLKVGSKITMILDEFRRAEDTGGYQALIDRLMHNSPTDHVLCKLIEAPQGINPVVALDNELEGRLLNQMSVEKLLQLNDQIDEVITKGQDENSKMESTLRGLDLIEAVPSLSVVTGF